MTNSFLLKSILIPFLGLSAYNQATMNSLFLPENNITACQPEKTEASNYKAGVRFMTKEGNCYKLQVSVYETVSSGTIYLIKSVIVKTGKGYKSDGRVLYNKPLGIENDPEYIIEDQLGGLNGTIEDFFIKNPDIYTEVIIEKNKIFAERK